MTPRVVEARTATPQEWDDAWESCGHATFFHSRQWAEVWSDYSGGTLKPAAQTIVMDDGSRVVFVACREPLHRGVTERVLSMPAGTYGGWLGGDELSADRARALFAHARRTAPVLWWRLNPFDPAVSSLLALADEDDTTHVLDLSGGFERVERDATHGHRSSARKALRAGVTVGRAAGADDWDAYYVLYESSLARWGEEATSRYDRRLFKALAGLERGVELWTASLDGRMVAGAVCLYARRHVSCWHAAALGESFPFRPVNLLYFEAARDACERGFSWFDFNPSGGHEGVAEFKRRFGAVELPAPIVQHTSGLVPRLAGWGARVRRQLGGASGSPEGTAGPEGTGSSGG